jgi:hypothetical protein
MVKLLIKLAIAALVANCAWRIGVEYVTYYKFKDDVRNAAVFRKGTDQELRKRIEMLADGYDVPLDDGDLSIASDQNRGSDHLVIDVSYAKPIQLVPGYEYVWPFSFTIDTIYSKRF